MFLIIILSIQILSLHYSHYAFKKTKQTSKTMCVETCMAELALGMWLSMRYKVPVTSRQTVMVNQTRTTSMDITMFLAETFHCALRLLFYGTVVGALRFGFIV